MRLLGPLFLAALVLASAPAAHAQDEAPVESPTERAAPGFEPSPNETAGEFTPAKGFDLVKTKRGSLNISFYGLVRYLNQLPSTQNYTDHLGRTQVVDARNDINWHRTMVWFSGFAFDPRFTYVITAWSLPSTQQTLVFGNLHFRFLDGLILGAGIGPTLTARSMLGSHPLWASSDRQMGEEFFRGGFSSGAWIRGEPLPRLHYWLSMNTNLSQLGVTAADDARDFVYSAAVSWLPTTGEFGFRGGFADFDEHDKLATMFGASAARGREDRASEITTAPNATQIRVSDGLLLFATDTLAPGVTVQKATYAEAALNAAFKYRGFTFVGEYYFRRLDDFVANGPLPLTSIFDHGFMAEAMYMAVSQLVGVYASGTYVRDDFGRFPWEISGGVNVYPFRTQSVRVNFHFIHVEKSPTGSSFGFYTAGQTGSTFSIGTDILL